MDSIFIYAQIAGFIAMCFSIAAWQFKKQEHILLCYVPSGFFWCVQYLLLGAYNGALFSFVAMFKDTALAKSGRAYLKYIVGAFIVFNIGLVSVFYKSAFDVLPLVICLLVNLPLLKKDNRYWMTRCNILAQICWMAFNLHAHAYMGVMCSTLIITSTFLGMARHEKWELGKCYKSFLPSLGRSLFNFNTPQTYP